MFTKMSGDSELQTKLENFKMEDPVALAKAFKEEDIEGFKDLEFEETEARTIEQINSAAKNAIESLDEGKLTSFIEESLKVNGDGDSDGSKEWLIYSHMRENPFYPFMVQTSIDLLSDKLKDEESGDENKYNAEGELDSENGNTLDQYISNCGGIDNIYGQGTRDIVTMVQKIFGLEPADGLAGPQFFEKVCSFLKGKDVDVSNFKVQGYDDEHPYPYSFEKTVTNDPEGRTKTDEKIDDNYTKYTITDLGNLVNKEKFPENSCVVYENDDVNYIFYNDGNVKDAIHYKKGKWSINEGNVEVIRDGEETNTKIYEKVAEETDENSVIVEADVKEEEIDNKDKNDDSEKLWDNLYKVYLPHGGGVSIEKNNSDSYKIMYKKMVLGEIKLGSNQLAEINIYDNGNIKYGIDNAPRPGEIKIELDNNSTTKYYTDKFVLDYGLGAKVEGDLLKFYDASGNYTNKYIGMDAENGNIICDEHDNNMYAKTETGSDGGKDIKITQDPNDSNKYYANRKEDAES